jgi:hypothetical protein
MGSNRHGDFTATAVERLDAGSIPEPNTGCQLWVRSTRHGYGTLWVLGVAYRAHRLSWQLANGPIPDGLFVCHRCDTPSCINPLHLFLGTIADNTADMVRKGRNRTNPYRGGRHPNAKLTDDQADAIRRVMAAGGNLKEVAREFGIDRTSVTNVVKGRTYRRAA